MMQPDHQTATVDGAAAYERIRALSEDDYDEPERPDPSDYAGLADEIYGRRPP